MESPDDLQPGRLVRLSARVQRLVAPNASLMTGPGTIDALMSVGPAFALVMTAVIAGAAWVARGTSEELRRVAAREWEQRLTVVPARDGRVAA